MARNSPTLTMPDLCDAMASLARSRRGESAEPRLEPAPLLEALRAAGTAHIYADSADVQEIGGLGGGTVPAEIDGNTANQPLVRKVAARYLDAGDAAEWARTLRGVGAGEKEILPLLYAVILGRLADDVVGAFAGSRSWEISLQLHMGVTDDLETARNVGRLLRHVAPSCFVKVPFTPHAPSCFLLARDLEREGIPVNFTSTFSARQAVAAALLADVSRTNIFMGRLNQGLKADLLGEHVDLEAQRALIELRRDHGVKTQLIVASMRDWQTFDRVAGCDVFTAPCSVIDDFLAQGDVKPGDIESRLETSYEDRLGIADDVRDLVEDELISCLYRVEPEFVEFLLDFRGSREYAAMDDGDLMYRRFDEAGFRDLFYSPMEVDWHELRRDKLPDLNGDLVKRLPIDTLYTLHAHVDFEKHQDAIDDEIRKRLP